MKKQQVFLLEVKVQRIYVSRCGEGIHTGKLMTFFNLGGSPFNDTSMDGALLDMDKLINKAKNEMLPVFITGAEPLLQYKEVQELSKTLVDELPVFIETRGTILWNNKDFDSRVLFCARPSEPTSGKEKFNCYEALDNLGQNDELKLCIKTHQDYDWALNLINIKNLDEKTNVFLKPAGGVYAKNLWRWAQYERRVRLMLDVNRVVAYK